jgi:response regulator RpfG family c-di-GMP phosphodiesterase
MNVRQTIAIACLLLIAVAACSAREETYEQLKARAEASKPTSQDKLFAEVSLRAVMLARSLYNQGHTDKAQAAAQEAATYAEKARDAAQSTGKNLKRTEIMLREAARRLEELRQDLSVEDRPPVEAAEQRIQAARQAVLTKMFGPMGGPKEKP